MDDGPQDWWGWSHGVQLSVSSTPHLFEVLSPELHKNRKTLAGVASRGIPAVVNRWPG